MVRKMASIGLIALLVLNTFLALSPAKNAQIAAAAAQCTKTILTEAKMRESIMEMLERKERQDYEADREYE